MESEFFVLTLLRGHAAGTLAAIVVFLAREPTRRLFGAQLAYRLWAIVPISAAASLFPVFAEFTASRGTGSTVERIVSQALGASGFWAGEAQICLLLWAFGATILAASFVASELRFRRRSRCGLEGPAMVGLAFPRLVVPYDYRERFSVGERVLIRLHERTHVEHGHLTWNAVAALLQILWWFNPLTHVAVAALRMDQELACDEAVVEQTGYKRKLYAQALLKGSTSHSSPFSCPLSTSGRALRKRLRSLSQERISSIRYLVGFSAIGASGVLLVAGFWAAAPAEGYQRLSALEVNHALTLSPLAGQSVLPSVVCRK